MAFWKDFLIPVAGAAASALVNTVINNKTNKALAKSTDKAIAAQQENLARVEQLTAGQRGDADYARGKMKEMLEPGYDHTKEPGYDFLVSEMEKAHERSASASYGVGGGRYDKELARYRSGIASQDFGGRYSRLSQLAGLGQGGITNYINASTGAASNLGNIYGAAGVNKANVNSQYASIANQFGQNVAGAYDQSRLLYGLPGD